MNICIFDCETNGKVKDWKLPMSEVDNFPRVIQLGWIVSDMDGKILRKHCYLVRPEGFEIPTEEFWVTHGFTQQKSALLGINIKHLLDIFIDDLSGCDAIVSHNINFDYNTVGAEMIRAGVRSRQVIPRKICTMELSVDLCKIPFGNDRRPWKNKSYKWPKLSELYQFLFNKDFESAHDALADVNACMDCFFEMVKRGVIKIELPEMINQTASV